VRRLLTPVILVLAAAARLHGADDPLAPYKVVDIKPSVASLYIASVTMTMPPFVRKNTVYSSTYYAKVFPYFFWSEKGRIWIIVPDAELRRASLGQPVDFVGHALSDSGDERKVQGRAIPTGAYGGRIRVRVFISRRISLDYDTTYELKGAANPAAALIPK